MHEGNDKIFHLKMEVVTLKKHIKKLMAGKDQSETNDVSETQKVTESQTLASSFLPQVSTTKKPAVETNN